MPYSISNISVSNSLSKNENIKSASSIKVLSPQSSDINITHVTSLPFLDFMIFIFLYFHLLVLSLD